MLTKVSDLLDVIHMVIIKNEGVNEIILDEIKSIDEKIKTGQLVNYTVDVPLFSTIVISEYNLLNSSK